jgi:hypothetical protein
VEFRRFVFRLGFLDSDRDFVFLDFRDLFVHYSL